jgi:hypothetical protein
MPEELTSNEEIVYFEFVSDRAAFVAFDPEFTISQNRMLALSIKNEGLRRQKLGLSDMGRLLCVSRSSEIKRCA